MIADDLVVIGNGRIVAQGAKEDLLRSAGSIVRAADRHVVARALDDSGISSSLVGNDGLLAQAEGAASDNRERAALDQFTARVRADVRSTGVRALLLRDAAALLAAPQA